MPRKILVYSAAEMLPTRENTSTNRAQYEVGTDCLVRSRMSLIRLQNFAGSEAVLLGAVAYHIYLYRESDPAVVLALLLGRCSDSCLLDPKQLFVYHFNPYPDPHPAFLPLLLWVVGGTARISIHFVASHRNLRPLEKYALNTARSPPRIITPFRRACY